MSAYDFNRQQWTDLEDVEVAQAKRTLEILKGPRGEEYAKFIGTDRQQMIKNLESQVGGAQ